MKILIIEDEPIAAERLENMLATISPIYKVIAKLQSVQESKKWLSQNSADLIFLDIQLSDGISFSIFDDVEISTPIIFTTAYDQYALKAFELNSISYLLKPIQQKELEKSLHKLRELRTTLEPSLADVLESLKPSIKTHKNRFLVKIGEHLRSISTSEIAYFYAFEKSTFLRTFEGKRIIIDYSLDELENLVDPAQFFRINRGYLININSIDAMYSWSRSRINIDLNPSPVDNKDTIVSVQRSTSFKKWIGE